MSSDNQFTALGPAVVGFRTDDANIQIGAQISGNTVGIKGSCQGSVGEGVQGTENFSGVAGLGGANSGTGVIGFGGGAGTGGRVLAPVLPTRLRPVRRGSTGRAATEHLASSAKRGLGSPTAF